MDQFLGFSGLDIIFLYLAQDFCQNQQLFIRFTGVSRVLPALSDQNPDTEREDNNETRNPTCRMPFLFHG